MNIGKFIVIFAALVIPVAAICLALVARADRRQGTERMTRPKPPDRKDEEA